MVQERFIGFPMVALGGSAPYVHAAAQAVETENIQLRVIKLS